MSATSPEVAICGMALRLPGRVRDPDAFWDALITGRDLRGPIPPDRYSSEGYTDHCGKRGAIKTQAGYFLDEDLGCLDTSFFSMGRKEVERCDPQQRQLLEVAREAFESAGEAEFRGKNIGCYVGTFSEDWLQMTARELQHSGGYLLTGHGDLMCANRLSYEYDLKGPSMVLKTGCSASLVALHEACRALQNGDCTGALVGGVNLIMGPTTSAAMTEEGMLAPDGSSKTFDAGANGYGRAEAVNAVYIKLLDDAIRDGNPIRAVIRNSGTNSDGRSQNLLTPNGSAHEALMNKVYADAGLDPAKTAFVECHGTGTPTGDRLEANAVGNVFGSEGVYIGSVKPNVGHSEGASGLTSLIKGVLALENKTIPPNIKFSEPNPKSNFEEKKLAVPVKPEPWPSGRDERVSINSFGIGGSNAHVIIESPPRSVTPDRTASQDQLSPTEPQSRLLVLSANTATSLQQRIVDIQGYLERYPWAVEDLAYTLACRRESLAHRAFIVASPDGKVVETSPPAKVLSSDPRVVMIFSGQGAQWAGMGKELLQTDEDFKRDIQGMNHALKSLPHPPQWNIQDELLAPAESSRISTAELAQPLCTALQVALVNRLRRSGILPAAVIGHSSGEIAAAYAANMLSSDAAITTAYYRGLVTKSNFASSSSSSGGMAAVGLGVEDVIPFLGEEGKSGAVTIACDNSPSSTTLSGDVDALERVLARVKEANKDTLARRLNVDMAYHSKHMELLADQYESLLEAVWSSHYCCDEGVDLPPTPPGPTKIPMYSSVFNKTIASSQDLGPSYWVSNLVSRVRFTDAVRLAVQEQGRGSFAKDSVLLEVGPHCTLRGPLRQITEASGVDSCRYASVLVRGKDARNTSLSALGHLYQCGVDMDWSSSVGVPVAGKTLTNLPNYPWDHSSGSFWYEARVSRESRLRQFGHHRLLGVRVPESSGLEPLWRNQLNLVDEPWLADHKVRSDVVFPFAGYIAMAGEALRQTTGLDGVGYRVRNASVKSAMMLSDESVEVVTSLRTVKLTGSTDSSWYDFCVMSYGKSSWTKHCEGQIKAYNTQGLEPLPATPPESMVRAIPSPRWYRSMDKIGVMYGPEFQALSSIVSSTVENVATAAIDVSSSQREDAAFQLHPVAIDACLQLLLVAMVKGIGRNFGKLCIPTTIKDLIVGPKSNKIMEATARSVTAADGAGDDELSVDVTYGTGSDKTVALRLEGLTLTPVDDGEILQDDQEPHAAARLEWLPDFDMVDHGTLFTPPRSIPAETRLQEEMTLLCMIETLQRVQGLEPCNWHFEKFRDWLAIEVQRARDGTYPLLPSDEAKAYLDLDSATRHAMIEERCERLLTMSKGAVATGIKRIYDSCEDIFTGSKDTLDTLMQGDVLTRIYDAVSFGKGDFFKLLSHSQPGLRILEVGSGTGGTTEMILRNLVRPTGGLPAYSVYTFSDISAGFFPQARERFSYAPNMEYRVFDISKNPFDQGFQPDTYDVILAPNVIHATPSLAETLANLQPLLRPGGLLVLTELCAVVRTPNYIFGNFSGWWLGEADGRPLEPYVGVDRWDADLKAAGFSGIDTAVRDAEEPYHYCAAIVSTKLGRAQEEEDAAAAPPRLSILTDNPDGPLALGVATEFERYKIETAVYGLGDELPRDQDVVSLLDLESYFFQDLTPERMASFQQILRQYESGSLLWVTKPAQLKCRDPKSAQALGVMRSIRAESHVPIYTMEIDAGEPGLPGLVRKVLSKIRRHHKDVGSLAPDKEYVVDEGTVKIGRYQPFLVNKELGELQQVDKGTQDVVTSLQTTSPGSLEKLCWVASPPCSERSPGDNEVVIETRAVGLNFKDLLYAMGILRHAANENIPFGLEISGVVTKVGSQVSGLNPGDKVVALPPDACFKTSVIAPAVLVQKIPAGMSFEEAATMPICFATALEALLNMGQLEKGQSVLIHSATGGLGQAAIQICRSAGAEIFATVSSQQKVDYLIKTFGIPGDHIFQSRDDSFATDLKRATCNRGVDIVLNTVSGELLHASWDCVAEFGKMIELGKRDIVDGGRLAMGNFQQNRSYCCVDLTHMVQRRPQRAGALLARCIKMYESGQLTPIPPTKFEATAVKDAFGWIRDGDHIGKAVVTMPENVGLDADFQQPMRLRLRGDASYLMTGGFGGLGTVIATWMVEHGAKSLVFLSRSAGQKPQDQAVVRELQTMGCSVSCVAGHAESAADIKKAISLAPHQVRGVIHLAMVLKDSPVADMSHDYWAAANEPKVRGAWNLHEALADAPMDFFVMASSLVTVVEQPGQGNYSASNTFLEAFTQYRRSLGLPASVLNICPVDDVGFVAENPVARSNMKAQGLYFLAEKELLDFLELSIRLSPASASTNSHLHTTNAAGHSVERLRYADPWTSTGQIVMGLRAEGDLRDPSTRTNWRRDRRMGFYHNVQADGTELSSRGGRSANEALSRFLEQAAANPATLTEAESVEFLGREVGAKVFSLMLKEDDEVVDTSLTLQQIGLDSLMAIELRRWWKNSLGLEITVLDIMALGTLEALGEAAAAGLKTKLEQSTAV
ncbi:hypothetical protein PspLS_03907 [Pyricularia sp. CBS 133598]|nr:hypothetical protein PspLS_03907 [Pyricularia sp. CBS 133598]